MCFSTKKKYHGHIRTHDPTLAQICPKCGKKFKNKENAVKHEKTAHSGFKPEPQQCNICGTWYTTVAGLRLHMRNIHESAGKEHRCHICNRVAATPRALKSHILLNHRFKERYKCHLCDKAFNRSSELKEHISVHTGVALYACPICPTNFSYSSNMYKHLKNVHTAEYEAYKEEGANISLLKIAKTASEEKFLKKRSNVSSSTCSPRDNLIASSHVVISPDETYTIEIERATSLFDYFPTKSKLNKHMRTHDASLAQICEKCGKKFKNKGIAQRHEKVAHSDYKPEPQQCPICNNWYTNETGLRAHIRNAHDDTGKEHRCHVCDKVLITLRALKSHIHLNHKTKDKFKCNLCDRSFYRPQRLKEHMTTHTGGALYACLHCPATFSHGPVVYKHFQTKHKDLYEEFKQKASNTTHPNYLKIIKLASKEIPTDVSINGDITISTDNNQALKIEKD